MLVELGVEGVVWSISFLRPPAGEGGCFIVDEYPAVFHARLAVGCRFIEDMDLVVLCSGDVGPEMESRYVSFSEDLQGYRFEPTEISPSALQA